MMILSALFTPTPGELYLDPETLRTYIFTGIKWEIMAGIPATEYLAPTAAELATNVSLKNAWDEYLIVRKLLGL